MEPKNFAMNNVAQETKNVLVISDLADNVNDQDLEIFFEEFKDSILVIQYNRPRTEFLGSKANSATVIFKEFKEAEKAKYELNMRKLKGKTCRITWHERDSSVRYNNQVNLYIKNIPSQVTPRDFYEYFCTFGDIVSAKLVENEEGTHLGYGYVHFASNESKNKCIEASDEKEIWTGSKLKVENFQKKQERGNPSTLNPNKSIFMKNFPNDYDEKKVKELIGGEVQLSWLKVMTDPKERKYAILILENEEDSAKVKTLNKKVINGQELYVDNLMNKHDRKRYLTSKIHEQNTQLTRKFRDCNLHVRNLPSDLKEEGLRNYFSVFGEIKSVKIPQTTTVTKIKGEFVETTLSSGYGFVCFIDPEAAKKAFEEMSGKILEGCQRALILSYFMPKNERDQALSTGGFNKKNMNWEGFNMNQAFMGDVVYGNKGHLKQAPGNFQKQGVVNVESKVNETEMFNTQKQVEKKQQDEPDYELLKNMEDDSSKKDYLGEFIFRKIESHQLTETHNLTMDHIGKITGMILGIEDVNEIIDICKNVHHLTSRIMEALNLLNTN